MGRVGVGGTRGTAWDCVGRVAVGGTRFDTSQARLRPVLTVDLVNSAISGVIPGECDLIGCVSVCISQLFCQMPAPIPPIYGGEGDFNVYTVMLDR